jgi:hypothetical protein
MSGRNRFAPSAVALAMALAVARAPAQEPPKPPPEPAPKPAPAAPPAAHEPSKEPQESKGTPAKGGFESVVPSGTLLYVGVDSLEQMRADWRASSYGRLVADPSNEALKKAFDRLYAELGSTTEKEFGVDLVDAFERVTGRLGLGIFGTLDESDHDFGFTIAAEAGERIAELRASVQKLFEHGSEKQGLVLKSEKEGDVEVTVAVAKESESNTPDLRVGAAGPVLVVDGAAGHLRERPNFQNALAALKGEGKESLGSRADFRDSRASRAGGVKVWFDTGALARASLAEQRKDPKEFLENPSAQVASTLSVDELGPLSARIDVNASEMRIEVLQAWSGKGFLTQLLTSWLSGNDFSLLKWIPADAEHALAVHVDFAKGMEAAAALEKAVTGADPAAAGADANAPPDADAPPDPKKDFMDHLDGRITLFMASVDPSEALPMPELGKPRGLCLALGVKSPEPLRASLDKVLRAMGLHAVRKKIDFQGFEVFSVPVTPLTIQYAILDDVAVISSSLTMLEDVLRRKSDKELKNLAGDPGFKRNFDALSPGASLVFWSRSDPSLYSTLGAPLSTRGPLTPLPFPGGESGDDGDEAGGAKPAGAGGEAPSMEKSLESELAGVLDALSKIDPAVAVKHLPAGSVIGLGASASGVHLEGVSR